MPWTDYRREWMEAAELQEERSSKAWAALLLLLLARESAAKRGVLRVLKPIPTSGGRWSYRSVRVGRGARSRLLRVTTDFRSTTISEVSAFQAGELGRARTFWENGASGALARLDRDLGRTPPGDIGEPRLRFPKRRTKSLEEALDGWDATERDSIYVDAEWNPKRWIREGADKLYEESARLMIPGQPEDDLYQMLLGSGSPVDRRATATDWGNGWALNRNNMYLSSVNHWRAVHRSNTVAAARSMGVERLMLIPPKSKIAAIGRGSILGQHVYRIRTREEWERAIQSVNRTRRTSASIRNLGFGYGDTTYLVPVPTLYLDAAVADAAKMRSKWERRVAA